MATVNVGQTVTVFAAQDGSLVLTPGSAGRISFNGRTVDGSSIAPRELYSAATISVSAGSTFSVEAVGADATYTLTYTGVSSASSSSGGGLGANDLTAITTEADPINGGFRLATAQQSGVATAISYNGSGDISAVTIDLPTTDIVSTYNYTDNLPYISGNWYVGGGLRMSSAQASEFKTNLMAAGATAAGFRIFVHDLGQGVNLEWNATAQSYRGINGSPILLSDDRTAGTNLLTNTTETAAQKTVTVPGWLSATHSIFLVEAHTTWSGTGRTTGTARVKFGGTTVAQTAAAAAQITFVQRAAVLNTASKSAQKFWPATASTAMALLGETTSGAFTTGAINTGNDTAITITHQVDAFTSDSAVCNFFRVVVVNP